MPVFKEAPGLSRGEHVKKIIVYFHGFRSNPRGDKVERLRAVKNSIVYAFDINVDPEIALTDIEYQLDDILWTDPFETASLIFVGTSLGAWYAAKLAKQYDAEPFLINPCWDPQNSLKKYGVDQTILDKYEDIVFPPRTRLYIASEDDVIDHWAYFDGYVDHCDNIELLEVTERVTHRYNGPEFDTVIRDIDEI